MRFRVASLRWLLPALFLLPAVDAFSVLPSIDSAIVAQCLVGALALCLLLTRLKGRPMRDLWASVLLFIFLGGYVIKSVWFVRNLGQPDFMSRLNPAFTLVTPLAIAIGFRWFTLAFVTFCVVAWLMLADPPQRQQVRQRRRLFQKLVTWRRLARGRNTLVAVVVVALATLVGATQLSLGFGVMGGEASTLPFRLGTFIIRFRMDVAGGILLVCVWVAGLAHSRWQSATAVGGLLWLGLIDSFIRTSRGSLLIFLLPLGFLWMLTGRFTTGRKAALALVLLATIVTYPLISEMRYWRVVAMQTPVEAAQSAIAVVQVSNPLGLLGAMISTVLARIIGADGIWFALDDPRTDRMVERVRRSIVDQSVTEYFTREIMHVDDPADFRAPGLVGAFMLLGGWPAVVLFTWLFVYAAGWLWRWMAGLVTAPVAQALYANALLFFASEGTLQLQNILSLVVVVLLCDWLYRRVLLVRRRW